MLGLAVAEAVTWASLLTAVAALCAMLARRPTLVAWKNGRARPANLIGSVALFAGAAGAVAGLLVLRPDLWPVLAIPGALFAADFTVLLGGAARTAWGEIPGIAGLAMVSALAHASANPEVEDEAWALGVLTVLYFVGSIPFVRGYVRASSAVRRGEPKPREAAAPAAIYYVAALNVVGMAAALRWMPLLSLLALVPAALKAIWLAFGRGRLDRPIQRVGLLEVFHSLLFALLAWLVFLAG